MDTTSAPPPVGVGIVGLGFGRRVHLPAFRQLDGARVVALCSRDEESARGAAERAGVPRGYGDWRRLVDDDEVELVSIATPPATHREIALAALALGKPVLCEKPLAASYADAEEMAAAAEAAGVPAAVDFEFRAVPAFKRARELLRAGSIGRVREVEVTWRLPTRVADLPPSWKDRVEEGGGALLSLGVHVFDYVEWLAGGVSELTGSVASVSGRASDDACSAALRLRNGATASVSISTVDPLGCGHRVHVAGDRGSLTLDNADLSDYMRRFTLSVDGMPVPLPAPPPGDGRLPAFTELARELLSAIREGRPAEPSFADGLRAQRLADAVLRSSGSGRWVPV